MSTRIFKHNEVLAKDESTFVWPDIETAPPSETTTDSYVAEAEQIRDEEVRLLISSTSQEQPNCVLLALACWGDSSIVKLASSIGQTVEEVDPKIKALSFLGVVRSTGFDEVGDQIYSIDPDVNFLLPA